ncbi:MAG: thiamine-phosphate kinase [Balneolaceae bacterium]|nr:thiamine-phosphate kinase [Balneolaceae bacterium]
MTDNSFRTVQSIGRTALIDELMEESPLKRDDVVRAEGDDTAVTIKDESTFSLLTSETFMEGVDFDLTYTPLNHLGYKVASAVASDIFAMNGTPEVMLVNLALPNKISVDMLKEIYRGIYSAGAEFGFQVVGGDLTASHQVLSMSLTCQGSVAKKKITYRKGAKTEEAVCVTGDLGGAIAGLRILMREKEYWQEHQQDQFQPDLGDYEYVVGRQLVPQARQDFIDQLAELEILPSSMIDITQGLVSELKEITESSNVGALIYQAAIPIAIETRQVADEMKEDVDKYALYGGEDLELLFTLDKDQVEKLADHFSDFVVIGKITEESEGLKMQTADGDLVSFEEE